MTPNLPPWLAKEQDKKSTLKPILITLLCSFLLAGGSCFAALRTFNYNRGGGAFWTVFMGVFLLAALGFVAACVLLIVETVRMSIHKKR